MNTVKFVSRKFLVWLASNVYVGLAFAFQPEVIPTALTWWGTISAIYIGGNVGSKFLENKEHDKCN